MTTVKTRPAEADYSFDVQIAALRERIFQNAHTGVPVWKYYLDRRGYSAANYGHTNVPERDGVKTLIGWLEDGVGGKAVWEELPSFAAPCCRIQAESGLLRLTVMLTFRGLQGPREAHSEFSYPSVEFAHWINQHWE